MYKWGNPLPDYLVVARHLKQSSRGPFTDKDVAHLQSLGAGDVSTEKLLGRIRFVLPYNFARFWIHFNHTRRRPCPGLVRTIIKNLNIAAFEAGDVMLQADFWFGQFPNQLLCFGVKNRHP